MKKTLLSIFAFCGILTATNAQIFEWASQIEGADINQGLSVSSNGLDIYSTGTFRGTSEFSPGSGVNNLTSNGGYDIYIQKLDETGNLIWAKNIGGTANDLGKVINDYSTHIIISGTFSNTVDFDPGAGTAMRTSNGGSDVFILALDPAGDFLWVQTFGESDDESIGGQELDSFNDIIITGSFIDSMTVDIGGVPETMYTTSGASSDIYVLKMDLLTGNAIWIKSFGSSSIDKGSGLVVKSNDNILLTGSFRNIMDADPDTSSTSVFTLNASTFTNTFLVELDPIGAFVNAFSFYNSNVMEVYDIELDANDNIYLTGPFKNTTDFDLKSGTTNLSSSGGQDCYIVKLTPAKDLVWAKAFGGPGLEQPFGIEVAANGDVYTAGRYSTNTDFDPGAAVNNQTAVGSGQDIFIHKLDAAGDFQLVYTFGQGGNDMARGLEIDIDGNMYVNGLFNGTIDFDPTGGTANLTAGSNTATDAFLLKFSALPLGISENENTEINIYPNPVQNKLFIELENETITELNVIDYAGRVVKTINGNIKTINVSDLTKGFYILKVTTENGILTNRFIKQ